MSQDASPLMLKKKLSMFTQMHDEMVLVIGVTMTNNAWPTVNLALYCPFPLFEYVTFDKFFIPNGTPSASPNFDAAIYKADFTKIIGTGATLQTGTNVIQTVTVTTTTLGPGMYYFGLASDSTGFQVKSCVGGTFPQSTYFGMGEQTTAYTLPDPMVPVQLTASRLYPLFGIVPVGGI